MKFSKSVLLAFVTSCAFNTPNAGLSGGEKTIRSDCPNAQTNGTETISIDTANDLLKFINANSYGFPGETFSISRTAKAEFRITSSGLDRECRAFWRTGLSAYVFMCKDSGELVL